MITSMFLVALAGIVDFAVGACSNGVGGSGVVGTQTRTTCTTAAGGALGFDVIPISETSACAITLKTADSSIEGSITTSTFYESVITSTSDEVSLEGHGFETVCTCDNSCPASSTTGSICAIGSYSVAKAGGGFACVTFSGGKLTVGDGASATSLASISGAFLAVTIDDDDEVIYSSGAVATSNNGNQLRALLLINENTNRAVFFSECGPFVVENGLQDRKRVQILQADTIGSGSFVSAATASGDPHLAGANGITFDVYGKPAANYSLLVATAFEVNMQLADRGPEMRFMTSMAVLYKGKSFVITPWTVKTNSAELIAHFEALGAKVNIDTPNWIITIDLCAQHTISFATRHSDNINFLNLEVRVPGCHNAYGGLLGQTYQCKYAREKFEWSREREEAFRVATLTTASDTYSPIATCAHEDEYRGEAIRGGSFSNGTLSMTTML
jgi:hypothetical protein